MKIVPTDIRSDSVRASADNRWIFEIFPGLQLEIEFGWILETQLGIQLANPLIAGSDSRTLHADEVELNSCSINTIT